MDDTLYEASNKIHQWYMMDRHVAELKNKATQLKHELEVIDDAIDECEGQLSSLRIDAIAATDPVEKYLEDKEC